MWSSHLTLRLLHTYLMITNNGINMIVNSISPPHSSKATPKSNTCRNRETSLPSPAHPAPPQWLNMDSSLESNPTGMRHSTWSVPGTTSNTLSWLRVSRMYRSFSGHISRHVPTKVLALSRSVLFTRAKRNQVKSKNVPHSYWEAREVHFHNDKQRNKNKNCFPFCYKAKKSKKHSWVSEKGKHCLSHQVTSHQDPRRPSRASPLSGWASNRHRPSGHTWVFMAPIMTLMINNHAAIFCSKDQSVKRKYWKYASIPNLSVFHHVFNRNHITEVSWILTWINCYPQNYTVTKVSIKWNEMQQPHNSKHSHLILFLKVPISINESFRNTKITSRT